MNLSIFAKVVEKGDLPSLLKRLHNKSLFKYIIAASWQDIWFDYFDPSQLNQVSDSDWGRAFGENLELRWRRDEEGEKFICRWIAEGVSVPQIEGIEGAESFPEVEFEVHEESFLLWGMPVWEDDGRWRRDSKGQRIWYVTRIPRVLVYPICDEMAKFWESGQKREPLCLRVRFYLREGRPVFDRFLDLEPYSSRSGKYQSEEGEKR